MSRSGARSALMIVVTVLAASACSDEGDGVAGNGGVGSSGGAAPGGSGGSPGGGGASAGAGGAAGSGAAGAVGGGGTNDGGLPENMALIPASTFTMGCTSQTFCYCDEYPSRTIGMTEFYIDRTEVTRSQYGQCVAAGACTPPSANPSMSFADKPDHPVTHVDWSQANAYCAWLGKHLPSGAQWERAYRSTDARVLPWGSAPLDCSLLNYGDCPLYDTKPVGSYPAGASAEGVLDLAGNVWEWMADWYDGAYYKEAAAEDPPGPASGPGHEYRGGGFKSGAERIRPYLRYLDADEKHASRVDQLGFRCASGGVNGTPYAPKCSCPDPAADPVCP